MTKQYNRDRHSSILPSNQSPDRCPGRPIRRTPRMIIGIDPLVDFAAQRVLGSPEHSRITIHFLNSVLRFTDRIMGVTILNCYRPNYGRCLC